VTETRWGDGEHEYAGGGGSVQTEKRNAGEEITSMAGINSQGGLLR